MSIKHLVGEPRAIAGGVFLTVNETDLGRTVIISQAALAAMAPNARSDREKVAYVMANANGLVHAALSKAVAFDMPQLLVLEPGDVDGVPKGPAITPRSSADNIR